MGGFSRIRLILTRLRREHFADGHHIHWRSGKEEHVLYKVRSSQCATREGCWGAVRAIREVLVPAHFCIRFNGSTGASWHIQEYFIISTVLGTHRLSLAQVFRPHCCAQRAGLVPHFCVPYTLRHHAISYQFSWIWLDHPRWQELPSLVWPIRSLLLRPPAQAKAYGSWKSSWLIQVAHLPFPT